MQSDAAEFRKASKTLSELEPLVQKFREYKVVEQDIAGAEELARGSDADEPVKPLPASSNRTTRLSRAGRSAARSSKTAKKPARSQKRK